MATQGILIVEDDAAALMLTRRVLSKIFPDINIDVAMDGAEAVDKVNLAAQQQQLPTVVLLDWNLPKKHGREVLAELRQNPDTEELPIVIVTSSSAEPDKSEAFNLGANEFVHKALSLDEFRQSLTETCQRYL